MFVAKRKQPDLEPGSRHSLSGHSKGSAALLTPQRSLSADSIPALSAGSDRPQSVFVEPPAASASMKTLILRRQFQQLLVAFATGVLVTYAVTSWVDHNHARTRSQTLQLQQVSDVCPTQRAPGISMAPLALIKATGDPSITTDRLIVAARHDEDTSWLDVYLADIPHVVYQVDDPENTPGAQHATLLNKGNEAMSYLQFIIDYYDRLPANIVFIHGEREAWHMKDHVPVLRRLRWGNVPFANLRFATGPDRHLQWKCQIGAREEGINTIFDCDWVGNHVRPGRYPIREAKDIWSGNKDEWWDSVELDQVWNQTFLTELGPAPPELHAPCCAEFMVARSKILSHPKAFYEHLRDWIIRTELSRYRAGRVFEYLWHYMFGQTAIINPVPECELLICEEVLAPVNMTFPAKATATHVHAGAGQEISIS